MESRPYSPAPSSPVPKRPSFATVAVLCVIFSVVAYFAGRANLIPIPVPAAPPAVIVPDAPWLGVWFKKRDGAEGFELPAIEFRSGARGMTGRMINPGPEHDVGREVEDLVVGEDGLTFVLTADGRVKYRLVRTAADNADLVSVPDVGHDLNIYLGKQREGAASTHSPEKRDKVLANLNTPRASERVARMVRVSQSAAAAAGSGPLVPAPVVPPGREVVR